MVEILLRHMPQLLFLIIIRIIIYYDYFLFESSEAALRLLFYFTNTRNAFSLLLACALYKINVSFINLFIQ